MFERLIGNEKVKTILNNIIEPTHAYMFTGTEGIGKSLFAKEFANKFLCIEANKPCLKCKSCIQFIDGNNMDFKIIDTTETSIKIEQIREIIAKIYEKPILSDKKVYIINNADKMTVQAQNCLLKILEEPPHYVIMILIVSNEHAILNTIKSRCIKIQFDKIDDETLKNYLEERNIHSTNDMLKLYNGSIGRALELQENTEKYISLNNILNSNSKLEFMQIAKLIYENKESVLQFLEYMNMLFFTHISENINYAKCIDSINEASAKLNYNCNVEMVIDEMMLSIWNNIQ